MPFYHLLNSDTTEGERTIRRLLQLRKVLQQSIPSRTLKETLLLATWNIRDFDKPSFGKRMDEAIYYIAEIVAHFDLVAIQEVYQDLEGLERVMKILGSHWQYICTDTTEGSQGNNERMAFVYDTRKIKFGGLAGELVLPPVKDQAGNSHPVTQLWRTPFMVGFEAGWTRFILTTVHILWGGSQANPPERINEIQQIAQFLRKRTLDPTAWTRNLILLGDFNIFGTDDATFQQLIEAGFVVPEQLLEFRSNAKKTRHYDQIALRVRPNHLNLTGKAGVFDYYQVVYQDTLDEKESYLEYMEDYEIKKDGQPRSERSKQNYYQTYWRTHQMSDHLPMWVELQIDYSDEYLQRKLDENP